MTERERWVVYPLLFLALGAALRDKLVDRTMTKSIVCQELQVVDQEPLGHQPPRVLARIGRAEPKGGGEAVGLFSIDGDMEIVNGDLASNPPPPPLVTIGRGNLAVGGRPNIGGQINVDGVVNAKLFAYQGVPFIPSWPTLPGVSLPDLFRAMQQAGHDRQQQKAPHSQPNANQPKPLPGAKSKAGQNDAPQSPPATEESDGKK